MENPGLRFQLYFANVDSIGVQGEGYFTPLERSEQKLRMLKQAQGAVEQAFLLLKESPGFNWIEYGSGTECYVQTEEEAVKFAERTERTIGKTNLSFQPLRNYHGRVGFIRMIEFGGFTRKNLTTLVNRIYALGTPLNKNIRYRAYTRGTPLNANEEAIHRGVIKSLLYERQIGDLG